MIRRLRITVDGNPYEVEVETLDVEESEPRRAARSASRAAAPAAAAAPAPAAAAAGPGDLPSPLAGKVVTIDKPEGSEVKAGETVITLEAMKMNTFVTASKDGVIKKVHVAVGDGVEEGQPLATIG